MRTLIGLLIVAAGQGYAQVSISSIQASQVGGTPLNIQAITSGTFLEQGGFTLYINGSFLSQPSGTTVVWTNTDTNQTLVLGQPFVTPTQVQVFIPQSLYFTPVTAVQAVQITVTQGQSATGQFFVNPPMTLAASPLPVATVGVPYSAPLVNGGTGPYFLQGSSGAPPGLTAGTGNLNQSITGTPTTPGVYTVVPTMIDQWDNVVENPVTLQVVANASLTSLTPNAAAAGAPQMSMAVLGTGFVDPLSPAGGSIVQWRFNNVTTDLPTAYVSSTQLTAAIPTALLAVPGFAGVTVLQPGGVSSNSLPFAVLAPAITALSRTTAPQGSAAFGLTVTGGNFADRTSTPSIGGALTPEVRFGATLLAPTAFTAASVTVTVPANLLTTPGNIPVLVVNPGGSVSNTLTFVVTPTLAITTQNLPGGTAGAAYQVRMAATGGVGSYTWSAAGLPAGLGIAPATGDITGTPASAGTSTVTVTVTDSQGASAQAVYAIAIGAPPPATLAITTPNLPGGTAGAAYQVRLAATGGVGPYTWSAAGLPVGLGTDPKTGDITGTPVATGTSTVTVTVIDSRGASAQAVYTVVIGTPPPSISTPSGLPSGTVGTLYQATIGVVGSGGPFTFAVTAGALPDGLVLIPNGLISGTPVKAATFSFSITASDPNGNAPSKGFTITIVPAPLTIPGTGVFTAPAGVPATFGVGATGGVTPYRYTVNCTLPPGLSFSNGAISGTPTTAGTYTCPVTVGDGAGAVFTKDITITIVSPVFTFTGTALPQGQVGVTYSATISSTGGAAPIAYSATGLPSGLSLASSGALSGTPDTDGAFSFTATATDAAGAKITATFTITIIPGPLAIRTTALPDGVAGANYAASLVAIGGARPYSWTVTGLPGGLTASAAGAIAGSPNAAGQFSVTATVKDGAGTSVSAKFTLTIAGTPLTITTTAAPGGVVGMAYSVSFAATGGVAPLTWSAAGLPAGLAISSAGTVSGTPSAPGTSNATVTVRDAAGTSVSRTLAIVVALPAAPTLSFAGVTDTGIPLQQPRLTVALGAPFPVDVVVTLTLTFAADAGADDPSILFSSGERTAQITIPAGSTSGAADVGVQTGTVAGLITITAQLQAAGTDVTPAPAPRRTIRINAGAPVITAVTATRTAAGFTVTVTGYVTDREIGQAVFQLGAAPGANLGTASLTAAVDTLFGGYFGSAAAGPFGGQFVFTQAFTVSGGAQTVASVTVTLVNKVGSSGAVSANLN